MPDEDVTVTGTWTFTSDPTPVYVYFKTVNTKNELVKVESGVTYNANGSSWATLGKLVTATPVTPEKKNILGAEVKTSSNFGPGVKFCVSDFRQSQEWRWKAGRILA
ncbi:MAG: hypothetical protein ACLU38_06145 [Dysosmobacter sp.]